MGLKRNSFKKWQKYTNVNIYYLQNVYTRGYNPLPNSLYTHENVYNYFFLFYISYLGLVHDSVQHYTIILSTFGYFHDLFI